MAQVAMNGLDVISGTQGSNSIAMPKIMKSCVWPADGGHNFFEMSYDTSIFRAVTRFTNNLYILKKSTVMKPYS